MAKLCECGCGEPAPIAKMTSRANGYVKGEPCRFVNGHHMRGLRHRPESLQKMSARMLGVRNEDHPAWRRDDASYWAIHSHLRRSYPKRGICEECASEPGPTGSTGTQYALIHGRDYTRNRDDYRELCRSCHALYDSPLRQVAA